MKRQRLTIILFAITLTACGSCAKPVTVQPLPETPFTKAAKAADDIAGGIKLLIAAESNLERQGLITPQEGLKVIDALAVLNNANIAFTDDVGKASADKGAAVASGKAVIAAVSGLTGLTIKNEKAKQTFAGIMAGVNIAVGIVQGFTGQ